MLFKIWPTVVALLLKVSYLVKSNPYAKDQIVIQHVLQIRSPKATVCHFLSVGTSETILLKNVLQNLNSGQETAVNSIQLHSKSLVSNHSLASFKYSVPCAHVLSPGSDFSDLGRTWLKQYLFNHDVSYVHFVFESSIEEITTLFHHPLAKAIKYKTGLVVADESFQAFIVDDDGTLKVVSDVTMLPSENQLFTGRMLKIQHLPLPPYVVLDKQRRPLPNLGLSQQLATTAAQFYNFSFLPLTDMKPLNQLPNGTWRGIMYDLTEGDTDLFLFISAAVHRFPYVDFTIQITTIAVPFYTSHPEIKVKWQAMVYPFELEVWLLMLLLFTVSVPVFYIQLTFKTHSNFHRISAPGFQALAIPACALMQESFHIPREAKFLSVGFIFFALITTTCYNSNLMSFLTFPDPEFVPKTFDELASVAGDYNIYLYHVPGSVATIYLRNSDNPAHKLIQKKVKLETRLSNCLVNAAFERNSACLIYDVTGLASIASNLSFNPSWTPVMQSKDSMMHIIGSGFLQKNSRYLSAINYCFGLIRDAGLMQKWREDIHRYYRSKSREWMQDLRRKSDPLIDKFNQAMEKTLVTKLKPFTVENFVLCFGTFVVGAGLSLLAFAAEVSLIFFFKKSQVGNRGLLNRLDS